ncbi:transcriptional regulator, MerR family [Clostridium botulinum B str. Eklund 17B (NRP)]|uniref:Transcriptional regulator, MerR family n=1 Tax=Clostridium botulinum (strain Eklund 17B / Type B) TaxID=935198 RepID=B2TM28_CLOBB|nr:transcriptional regulator, MerR family [Clostridium botulinum B str. Eklund 17B (NRP)]MBY6977091.1 helix-turn-helix transcriptional regulator [Clostridium botulinum]MBY6999249.1 helix-turn-helix transcriptional regulator [Clostridium botulinum]MCR1272670.1 helix-turn-helix domain-containing protein [Clostridium botulinum]
MSVGEKLKLFRNKKDLTLKELNKLTGISISFISDIENNRRNPSIDNLKILAKALDVQVSQLLDEGTSRLPQKNISIDDKLDELEEDMKILFLKAKKLSKEDRQKVLKMMDIFVEENNN